MRVKLAVSLLVAACGGTTTEPAALADASSLDAATPSDGGAGVDASPVDAARDRSLPGGPCNTDDDCATVRFLCGDGGVKESPNHCEPTGTCTAFPVCNSPSCAC